MYYKNIGLKNFKRIGKLDVSKLIDKVSLLDDTAWNEFDQRQKFYHIHSHTKTIPLVYDLNTSNQAFLYKNIKNYIDEYNQLTELFTKYYGDGFIVRLVLVQLIPNGEIPEHKDYGDSLTRSKRHHIALVTNKNVIFTIGKESLNLKTGEIWEINNSEFHSVKNNSDQARIHLIADWITI